MLLIRLICVISVVFVSLKSIGEETETKDPFTRFKDIPEDLLMPKHAEIKIDEYGNYTVNGLPRHLFGVFMSYNNMEINIVPTAGYPPCLKWLYEDVLTYEYAQRLGFDSITVLGFPSWQKKIDANINMKLDTPGNRAMAKRMLENGLPLKVDYTAATWAHGSLPGNESLRSRFPEDAFNINWKGENNNHWVPYNIFHPAARELYRIIWESGIEELSSLSNNQILSFELFNEPAYNEPSEYNKRLFAAYLKEKFGNVGGMNRVFRHKFADFAEAASLEKLGVCAPLAVAWGRFQEKGFADLNRFGREVIRKKLPEARSCCQLLGGNYYRVLPNSNVNIFEINRYMDAVATPTSGGLTLKTRFESAPEWTLDAPANLSAIGEGILMRHLLRAIADGKPIHNPEAYSGNTFDENHNILWIDMLRGSGATYFFSWCRRTPEWIPARSEEGGRKHAERFSYVMTNPYAKSPEALAGIAAAKKEIFRFREFFTSRQRFASVPREVALMLSYPTERYGVPTGYVKKNEITAYAAALEFSHYPMDAFFEEQLQEERASRYKAVIAVGVRNTYPGSLKKLEDYVENGGILICARDLMPLDEYGNPVLSELFSGITWNDASQPVFKEIIMKGLKRPESLLGRIMGRNDREMSGDSSWDVLGMLGGSPAILRRRLGKGYVYLIAPMMQDYCIAAVLGAILEEHNIFPALDMRRVPQGDLAPNIEVHLSRKNNLELAFLLNLDSYPKLIEVKLPEGMALAADLLNNRILPLKNGKAMFVLPANHRFVLGFGEKTAMEQRFGLLEPCSEAEVNNNFEALMLKHQEVMKAKRMAGFSFDLDASAVVPLDLRNFANRGFVDDRPGDGTGGWTDQGRESSLHGVPWGLHSFAGVPCDLIRFDENHNKTCIVLASTSIKGELPSEVTGIPVNMMIQKIYFFHTAAWNRKKGDLVMSYRVNYADGSIQIIPVRDRIEIGNWWNVKDHSTEAEVAWHNSDNRGFYVMEWKNPDTSKEVSSIDVLSASGAVVPVVIGISVEQFMPGNGIYRFQPFRLHGWGGCKVEKYGDNSFIVKVDNNTKDWSGMRVNTEEQLILNPGILKTGVLKFTLTGGCDQFGNHHDGLSQNIKLQLLSRALEKTNSIILQRGKGERQVSIPLREFFANNKKHVKDISLVMFQFISAAQAGFEVKNLRIEYAEAENVKN
ncbi:MAG: hypothetical protein JXR78_18180 [Victivallales bacterium]|nr:hypothetical protein [Victivallales bacterium]